MNEQGGEKVMKEKNVKQKRKMSKQTILTISMIMVSLFVISVATYAWYLISNTPKITQAKFVADTVGNLKISHAIDDGNGGLIPEAYLDSIELYGKDRADDVKKRYFTPCTTEDGVTFYKPNYEEGKIKDFTEFDEAVPKDKTELHTKYIYEKVFYLRAGGEASTVDDDKAKYYDIHLIGMTTDEKKATVHDETNFDINYGTYMIDSTADQNGDVGTPYVANSAVNAMRISMVIENAQTDENAVNVDATTNKVKTVIFEPNADGDNNRDTDAEGNYTNYLEYAGGGSYGDFSGSNFLLLKQKQNKSFNFDGLDSDKDTQSDAFCTIKEGVDVKVTMRIWIEGMDDDCTNEIAADKILGQIQFISTENLDYVTKTASGN